MIQLNVHSQNIRGNLTDAIDNLASLMDNSDCECTAILLQDLGKTGPEGSPLLREGLGEHHIYANSKANNKSRTVAIIIYKSWQINQVYRLQWFLSWSPGVSCRY